MADMDLSEIVGKTFSKVRATNNVLSPLQWMLALILSSITPLLIWGPAEYRPLFVLIFVFIIGYFMVAYTYFAFRDPDRLHSEQHREQMTQITRDYLDDRGMRVVGSSTANTAGPQISTSELISGTPTPSGNKP